jgi:ubiquinone/menaquinone biosynthesis C-methylase UbiE
MNDTFADKAKTWDFNPQIMALADLFSAELDKIVPDHSGLAILEFGCGTGRVGLRYAEEAASLDMVDASPAMLDVLRTKDEARASHVTVHEGALSDLVGPGGAPESADWIISNMALHHVEDIPALLEEIHRLIKPGGRVTIGDLETEPGSFHAPDVVPHNGLDPHELTRLFEDGGFIVNRTHTFLSMPKEDNDGVTRTYSAFILDATRPPAKKETKMANLKASLACRLFKLKPAIENTVGKRKCRETVDSFKEHYREIDGRTDQEKGILAFHRMFSITGLALYKALHDEFQSQEELIDKIHDILWDGPMSKMIRFLAFFIRRSGDPFNRYLQILGPRNEWFFPCPPWEKVSVEIQDGIGWHQKKCPLVDFFKKEGVAELTRAYGDMDKRIAELLPEHIELRRENAMCTGDDYCDFLYYRKEQSCSGCRV